MIGSQIIKQTIKLEILINKQNLATITPSFKRKKITPSFKKKNLHNLKIYLLDCIFFRSLTCKSNFVPIGYYLLFDS